MVRDRYDIWYSSLTALVMEAVSEDDDPCWKDYQQVGMKKKNGKKVPNCVQAKEGLGGVEDRKNFVELAYDWHGGQSSPLYSYASTGGKVQNRDHAVGLLHELNDILPHARRDRPEDVHTIKAFIDWLQMNKIPAMEGRTRFKEGYTEEEVFGSAGFQETSPGFYVHNKIPYWIDANEEKVKVYKSCENNPELMYISESPNSALDYIKKKLKLDKAFHS